MGGREDDAARHEGAEGGEHKAEEEEEEEEEEDEIPVKHPARLGTTRETSVSFPRSSFLPPPPAHSPAEDAH
eukprot:451051-Hanusia_phi.AAC.1